MNKISDMKNILAFTFCLVALVSFGQDTIYYDYNWSKLKTIDRAYYYAIINRDQTDSNRVKQNVYHITGQLKSELIYSEFSKYLLEKFREWYKSGQIRKEFYFKNGKYDGDFLTYWENGKPKRVDFYKNDSLISGKCYNSGGQEVMYYNYNIAAEFPLGQKALSYFISGNLKYPEEMRKKGIEGRVHVSFMVEKDGRITNVEILRGVSPLLDAEALRVIRLMPDWNPCLIDGEAERTSFSIPIVFKLAK